MSIKVKDRRLNNPNQIKAMLTEQANLIRQNDKIDPVEKARVLTYISNTALSCYREGELLERVKEVEKLLEERT